DLLRPARADAALDVRTWVEDFRRVRSRRRYEVADARGELALRTVTDWVFVDLGSGRPRRVPAEMEQRFGVETKSGAARPAWRALRRRPRRIPGAAATVCAGPSSTRSVT